MKPKEIICIGTVLGVGFELFAVIMVMLGVIKCITDAEKSLTYIVCGVIAIFLVTVLDFVVTRAKEKINPLSYKRRLEALEYAVQKQHGKRQDFIQEHSEDIYNHFVKKGYIHPPMVDCGITWEITALGISTINTYKKTNKS